MNVRDLDLNLLQTFAAIHDTGSVSRAAARLGLTQPTVSHALGRLRHVFRDPLFVRTQGGMQPTAKAERLASAVHQALHIVELALQDEHRYDPAASTRTFRLHLTDVGEAVFLPRLMRDLASTAPGVRIEAEQVDEKSVADALDSGRVDLAIGALRTSETLRRAFLLHERHVILMRRDHPLAATPRLDRAALATLDYVLVRSHPANESALREMGLAERVRLTIPRFIALPRILAGTDLAAVVPEQLAAEFGAPGRFAVWRPRVALPVEDVSVHWSWRFDGDAGNRWLRERIVRLFATGEPPG